MDNKTTKLAARDLRIGEHFVQETLDEKHQALVKRFLESLSPPTIAQEKAKIAYQLLVVSG